MPDVEYCPNCGEAITSRQRQFREDLVLNRYRTEFECSACGFHGDLFRHEAGDETNDLVTDGGTARPADADDREYAKATLSLRMEGRSWSECVDALADEMERVESMADREEVDNAD